MNAIWVIVIMILWLATLGLLYVTNSDVQKQIDATTAAEQRRNDMESRYDDLNEKVQAISEVVGYRAEGGGVLATSDPAAITTALDAAKAALGPALGGDDSKVTLQQAVTVALANLAAANTRATQAATDHQTALAARQAAEANANQIQSTYQAQVAQLQQDLSDAQAAADNQAQNDQDRIDDVVSQNDTLDSSARDAQQALEDAQEAHRKEVARLNATISTLAMRRAPVAPADPDGRILEVSEGGSVAWIDLGGVHGLRNGTRFELLRRGRSGELISRGTVEVREVNSDTAMVGLLGDANPYDPMLPDDLVRSPTFSRSQTLHFHLLGEFPLSLSKEFVSGRLGELGGVVDDNLEVTTDVLVLGAKNLALGEDAPELTDTDEYRMAERLGMRIVRLTDLATFLRY